MMREKYLQLLDNIYCGTTRHRLFSNGRRDNAVLLSFLRLLPTALVDHGMNSLWLVFGHSFDYYINNKQPDSSVAQHLDTPYPATPVTIIAVIEQRGPDAAFILGQSDLFIHHPETLTTIRFTYEGELAVATNSDIFLHWLFDVWQAIGINPLVRGAGNCYQSALMTGSDATPAAICAEIRRQLEQAGQAQCLEQLNIVPDHHWIFLHNKQFAQGGSVYRGRIGKYKYDAIHHPDLLEAVVKLAPLVADNRLPVVKSTNIGNVTSGEKLLVAYCVKGVAEPGQVRELLRRELGERVYWGSDFFEPR